MVYIFGSSSFSNRVTTSGTHSGSTFLASGGKLTGPVPSLRLEMLVSVRRIVLGLCSKVVSGFENRFGSTYPSRYNSIQVTLAGE